MADRASLSPDLVAPPAWAEVALAEILALRQDQRRHANSRCTEELIFGIKKFLIVD
jgi:hypothetical protein